MKKWFTEKILDFRSIPYTYLLLLFSCIFLLQACSWAHILQLQNDTNNHYIIHYQLESENGVFSNEVPIYTYSDEQLTIVKAQNDIIRFEIGPKQRATIGIARNTSYKGYQKNTVYNEDSFWKQFINVKSINISNEDENYTIEPIDLKAVLTKNNITLARISLNKVIKNSK